MIEQYKQNRKIVDDLYNQLENKRNNADDAIKKLSLRYWNLQNELKKKENSETDNINAIFNKEEIKIKEIIAENYIIINQVKRVLLLKKIYKNPLDLFFEVKSYRDKYIELIDTLIKTKCIELRVYIYENDKPKNKYTLAVIGNSIFVDFDYKLIDLPRFYGLRINDNGSNISLCLKDNSTIENLKEYYHKNKDKFLKELLNQHAEIEKEYESVQKYYNTTAWEQLYWENEKEYYEKEVCGGTETEEYKIILKELAKL